jgi:hypothetical protein
MPHRCDSQRIVCQPRGNPCVSPPPKRKENPAKHKDHSFTLKLLTLICDSIICKECIAPSWSPKRYSQKNIRSTRSLWAPRMALPWRSMLLVVPNEARCAAAEAARRGNPSKSSLEWAGVSGRAGDPETGGRERVFCRVPHRPLPAEPGSSLQRRAPRGKGVVHGWKESGSVIGVVDLASAEGQ